MESDVLDSVLSIKEISQIANEEYQVKFNIDPENELFKGHFPKQPVLPGVVMVEIVRQCLQKIDGETYQMETASNLKFLKLLVPNNLVYTLKIAIKREADKNKISAQILQGDETYFKQSAVYIRI